jgi:hypothetical protein
MPNGPTSLSNGSLTHVPSSQSSVGGHVPKDSSAVLAAFPPTGSAVKQGNSTSGFDQLSPSAAPATVSGAYFSVSDPVLMPTVSQQPGAVVTNKHVGNKHVSQDVSDLELSKNVKAASKTVSSMHKKGAPSKSQAVQKNKVSDPSQSSSTVSDGSSAIRSSSDYANQSPEESVVPKEGTVLLVYIYIYIFSVGYLLHCCKDISLFFCCFLKLCGIIYLAHVVHFRILHAPNYVLFPIRFHLNCFLSPPNL